MNPLKQKKNQSKKKNSIVILSVGSCVLAAVIKVQLILPPGKHWIKCFR